MKTFRILLSIGGGAMLTIALDDKKYGNSTWKWKLLCGILMIAMSFLMIYTFET